MDDTRRACPLCKLPMRRIGRLVSAVDDVQQHFVFAVCAQCASRLERLPKALQHKLLNLAVAVLARHPDRYPAPQFFASAIEADLFVLLEAERLSNTIH